MSIPFRACDSIADFLREAGIKPNRLLVASDAWADMAGDALAMFAMGCAVLQVPSMAPGTIAAAYVLEELP